MLKEELEPGEDILKKGENKKREGSVKYTERKYIKETTRANDRDYANEDIGIIVIGKNNI